MYPTAIRMAPSRLGRVPSLKLSIRISAKSCTVKVDDTLYTPVNNDSAPGTVEDVEEVVREDVSSTSSAASVQVEISTISKEAVAVPSTGMTPQPEETKSFASTPKISNSVRSEGLLTSRSATPFKAITAVRASVARTQSEPIMDHKHIPISASLTIDTGIIGSGPLDEKLRLELLCEQASVHQIDKVNRQLRSIRALVVDIRGKHYLDMAAPQLSHYFLSLPVLHSYAARIFSELIKIDSMEYQLSLAKQSMEPIVTTIADEFPSRILFFSDTKCTVTYEIPLELYSRHMGGTPYQYAKRLASSRAEYRRLVKLVNQRRIDIQQIEKRFSTSDQLVIRGEIQRLGRDRNDQREAVYESYYAAVCDSGKLL